MEKLNRATGQLQSQIQQAYNQLNIDKKLEQEKELNERLADSEIWNNSAYAQSLTKKAASLHQETESWAGLKMRAQELSELVSLDDDTMINELTQQVNDLNNDFDKMKKALLFDGEYDNYSAIVKLSAGTGGTDAQDWTEMLERMYLRWAERAGYDVSLIERSTAEEAGIKGATYSISGQNAYGKLKGEHGVHRLVRLSPFNADNLRQTSFALVEVSPEIDEPDEVVIDEADLKIDVYRAGGHGGQSVNTTDSAVRVTHIPTGIVVAIQNERSQIQNKETALKIVRSKLAQLKLEQHAKSLAEITGPNIEAAWGNQIRNYVLHPYTLVKDTRTKYEERDTQSVLDGGLDGFIEQYLESQMMTAE